MFPLRKCFTTNREIVDKRQSLALFFHIADGDVTGTMADHKHALKTQKVKEDILEHKVTDKEWDLYKYYL